MIGMYGFGAACMLPLFLYFSNHSYRGGALCAVTFVMLGNLFYGFASVRNDWHHLVLGRFLCGLEFGVGPLGNNAALVLAPDGASRVSELAAMKFSVAIGLLFGPFISAVVSTLLPSMPTEQA